MEKIWKTSDNKKFLSDIWDSLYFKSSKSPPCLSSFNFLWQSIWLVAEATSLYLLMSSVILCHRQTSLQNYFFDEIIKELYFHQKILAMYYVLQKLYNFTKVDYLVFFLRTANKRLVTFQSQKANHNNVITVVSVSIRENDCRKNEKATLMSDLYKIRKGDYLV